MKSILILDSNKKYAKNISDVLSNLENVEITEKYKPTSAESQLSKIVFNLLIVNLSSKFDVINSLEKYEIDFPILFYSDEFDTDLYDKVKSFNFLGYLPKPFNIHAIKSIVESYLFKNDSVEEEEVFYYRKKGKLIPIVKREIEYINTDGNYCVLHLKDAIHTIRYPLAKLIEDFNYPMLKRAHRQYAVNILKVTQFDISNNECTVNGDGLPVGRAYKKLLKQSIAGSVSSQN